MSGVHGQHTNVYFNPCNCNWDNDMLILSPEFSSIWCLVIIDSPNETNSKSQAKL
jgi:hypothetical protein